MSVAISWDAAAARRAYREAMARVAAWWAAADPFEKPSLHRADIRAADRAIQAALAAQDAAALAAALAAWEAAIEGAAERGGPRGRGAE